MGRKSLARRENWQSDARKASDKIEKVVEGVVAILHDVRPELWYEIKPRLLIYQDRWAIEPDFLVKNLVTNKSAFFEVKRQNPGGNAHERVCRNLAPGIQRKCAPIAGFLSPFFFIATEGLAIDPKKREEIHTWFDAEGFRDRYLLWEPQDPATLIHWFSRSAMRCIDDTRIFAF